MTLNAYRGRNYAYKLTPPSSPSTDGGYAPGGLPSHSASRVLALVNVAMFETLKLLDPAGTYGKPVITLPAVWLSAAARAGR